MVNCYSVVKRMVTKGMLMVERRMPSLHRMTHHAVTVLETVDGYLSVRKARPTGLKPALISEAYAALKGRSSTAMHTFETFSAICEDVPAQNRAMKTAC